MTQLLQLGDVRIGHEEQELIGGLEHVVGARRDRTTAARTERAGSAREWTRLPTTGESSGRMSACIDTAAVLKENRRTGTPTDTASSTREVIMRGVETDTSTPHA